MSMPTGINKLPSINENTAQNRKDKHDKPSDVTLLIRSGKMQ